MCILVINMGSSSAKTTIFNISDEKKLGSCLVERIGAEGTQVTYKPLSGKKSGEEIVRNLPIGTHKESLQAVIDILISEDFGVITDLQDIKAVGHRVVHGGESFSNPVIVDEDVKEKIKSCFDLAPLHNPPNYQGILVCEEILPGVPQVAVFDTAFHQTIKPHAYTYGLSYDLYEKYGIRRYGFHGTSHRFVSLKAKEMLGAEKTQRIITCHLGNGSSITAIKDGKSIDTSMGFTPLDGVVMGTRSGTIDPGIIFFLERKGYSVEALDKLLNKESGLLGLARIESSDMRDITAQAKEGNKQAQLALDVFMYSLTKYVGSYIAVLGGLDVLIFTAGIGENSALTREYICNHFEYAGVKMDKDKNNLRGTVDISAADSIVKILVIPTDEELMIAKDAREVIKI